MKNHQHQLLIFDLDGTFIDSAPDIVTTVNTLMLERGREPLPVPQIVAAIGEGLKQMVFGLFPETHSDPVLLEELERHFFKLYEENLLIKTRTFSGVEKFLESATDYRIAVVTNKHERLARKVMEGLGLMRFPWLRIFGADSLPNRKPDPLPLLEVMRIAEVSRRETVMIGDGIPDMIAARRAGVHAIGIAFGYTKPEVLNAQGASLLLDTYDQLAIVLEDLARLPERSIEPA